MRNSLEQLERLYPGHPLVKEVRDHELSEGHDKAKIIELEIEIRRMRMAHSRDERRQQVSFFAPASLVGEFYGLVSRQGLKKGDAHRHAMRLWIDHAEGRE